MRSIKHFLVALSLLAIPAGNASALTILDNSTSSPIITDGVNIADNTSRDEARWKSFNFTTPSGYKWDLTSVYLAIYGVRSAKTGVDVTWSLYQNEGNTGTPKYQPTGTPYDPTDGFIASSITTNITIPRATANIAPIMHEFDLRSLPLLDPGTNYSLVAYTNTPVDELRVGVLTEYFEPTAYAGFVWHNELRFWGTNNPTKWTNQNVSAFELEATEVVPEPSTFILLGAGLGGLALLKSKSRKS